MHAGAPVTRDHLADRIWADREVRRPAHAVHTLLCRLRARLGDAPIATAGRCYTLTADDLDATAFRGLVAEARRAAAAGRTEAAADTYDRALALWHGPPLAGVPPGSHCVQAEQLRLTAVEERAEALLRLGRHRALLDELVPVAEAYPFRERLQGALMLALYRGGQAAEALARFRRAGDALADAYGIGPGTDLRRLHERILRADPDLSPAPAGLVQLRTELRGLQARVAELETAVAAMVDTPGRRPVDRTGRGA